MTLSVLSIPEDLPGRIAWLERALVGPDLRRIVSELYALHRPSPGGPTLVGLLGPMRRVLSDGLRGLTDEQVRGLLARPDLLAELQELVLTEGEPYWDAVAAADPDLRRGADRVRAALEAATRPGPLTPAGGRTGWDVQTVLLCLATAAAVFLAVRTLGVPATTPSAEVAWGWAAPGALPESATRGDYLRTLAAGGRAWFKERPETRETLARRVYEFRRGCTVLLLARHAPLPEADRQWLKERCRDWAGKIDGALRSLEAGEPADRVRADVDAVAEKLAGALAGRAAG